MRHEGSVQRKASESEGDDAPVRLTRMQFKILNGVRLGLLNKQIAFDLGISEATVKCHLTLVMRKLNVSNRTQAALFARDMELTGYDAPCEAVHPDLIKAKPAPKCARNKSGGHPALESALN
jgi:DNA-binding CsgD family transcriptional regulator